MKYPYFVMRNYAVIESVLQKYRLIFVSSQRLPGLAESEEQR